VTTKAEISTINIRPSRHHRKTVTIIFKNLIKHNMANQSSTTFNATFHNVVKDLTLSSLTIQ